MIMNEDEVSLVSMKVMKIIEVLNKHNVSFNMII